MLYSPYVISFEKEEYKYLFNTKNNLSIKIENKLLKKIKTDIKTKDQLISFLESNHFLKENDELENMIKIFKERDEKTLRITILAHGDCNFRCKYCYEKFSNCDISAKYESILYFIKKKLSEHRFEDLHVSWFGGEPLLGYKEILKISEELIKYAKLIGVNYHSDMTTNGYLLNRTILNRLITQCKVTNYQITVDGSKKGHDNQRVLKNGQGTYERILKNLKNATKLDLEFNIFIRLNVSKENYDDVCKFLEEDAQGFKGDERFKMLFRNVGDWGCGDRSKGYEVQLYDKDVSFGLSKLAIKMGYNLFDDIVFNSNYNACYAQKPHSYTIDTKGNLLKCTVALYNLENIIGELGNSSINQLNNKLWINSYKFRDECQKCNLLLICKGGTCPKRDIFYEISFEEKCSRMKQKIMNNFELSILSNRINYELRSE